MNRVIQILMRRDGLTKAEAERAVAECREAMLADTEFADEILMDHLGLEPDFIEDVLW